MRVWHISRQRALPVLGILLTALWTALSSAVASTTIYTVTSTEDNGGTCINTSCTTLRAAITNAPAGSTIQFEPDISGTITITGTPLELSKEIIINGPGRDVLSISGNDLIRVLEVDTGVTAMISGLTTA